MLQYLTVFLAGYFVGSIPTAYLLVKQRAGLNIHQEGSGNVGAFNVFSVTRSRTLAILVGALDGLKGFIVTWVSLHLMGLTFWMGAVAMLGSIIGHNYSVWLRFKGGRGLATAAGAFFGIGISYPILWCLSWIAFDRWKKDITTANVLSTILTPVALFLLPASWIYAVMLSQAEVGDYRIFAGIISVVVLVSHRDVFQNFLKQE